MAIYWYPGIGALVALMETSSRRETCLRSREDDDFLRKREFCDQYAYNSERILWSAATWPKVVINKFSQPNMFEESEFDKERFNTTDDPNKVLE